MTLLTLPEGTDGYLLHAGAGEALDSFLGGARVTIKATAKQTQGRFAAVEFWGSKGFGSPVHVHSNHDEFFVVLDGEVRFRLGDEVTDAEPRSIVYGPRGVAHAFTMNSEEARVLLFFGPAGIEGFFREVSAFAATVPAGQPPDMQIIGEIGARYGQQFIGPPLPPRD
jgi:quercetin dioxygenase-like cupin family protein